MQYQFNQIIEAYKATSTASLAATNQRFADILESTKASDAAANQRFADMLESNKAATQALVTSLKETGVKKELYKSSVAPK